MPARGARPTIHTAAAATTASPATVHGSQSARRARQAALRPPSSSQTPSTSTAFRARTRDRWPTGSGGRDSSRGSGGRCGRARAESTRRVEIELGRLLRQDRRHRVSRGFPAERPLPAQHLVEHRAEGEDVGAVIDRRGRAPAQGPCRQTCRRRCRSWSPRASRRSAVGCDGLGQAEVENLDVIVARDHHVLGLEIAMDDAAGVGGGDAARDLLRVADGAARASADRSPS